MERRSSNEPDLHSIIVERGAGTDVGDGLRRRLVRVRAVVSQLAPPYRWRRYDPTSHPIGDHRFRTERAAVIEDADAIAGRDTARVRVVGVDLQRRLAGRPAERGDIHE